MLLAIAMPFLSACSSDDDNDDDNRQETSEQTLYVNGVAWVSSTDYEPVYHGHFAVNGSYGLIFTKFTRNTTAIYNVYTPDVVWLDITMDIGNSITQGMEFVDNTDIFYGGGNSYATFTEGVVGEDSWREGTYNMKGATGSAVVVDLKENDHITIKYTNYKMPLLEQQVLSETVGPTLTLDGTVTYKYTDNLSDTY